MLCRSSIHLLRLDPNRIATLHTKSKLYLQHMTYVNDPCHKGETDALFKELLIGKSQLSFFVKPRINFRAILEESSQYKISIKERINKEDSTDLNIINMDQFSELLDYIPAYLELKKSHEKAAKKDKGISQLFNNIDLKRNFKNMENKILELALKLPNLLNNKLSNKINVTSNISNLKTNILFDYQVKQTNFIQNDDVFMEQFETENIISDYFNNINKTQSKQKPYYNLFTGPDFIRNEISNICDIPHHKVSKNDKLYVGSLQTLFKNEITNDCHDLGNIPFKSSNLILSPSPIYTHLAKFIKSATVCDDFPLAFFNIGNIYHNIDTANFVSNQDSIRDIPYQTRNASIFSLASNSEESSNSFLEMFNHILDFYKSLKISVLTKICEPWELERAESFKVNFYLKDPTSSHYIKCGYLSDIGDYLSQRLVIMGKFATQGEINNVHSEGIGKRPSSYFFHHCIHGQIANIPLISMALANKL